MTIKRKRSWNKSSIRAKQNLSRSLFGITSSHSNEWVVFTFLDFLVCEKRKIKTGGKENNTWWSKEKTAARNLCEWRQMKILWILLNTDEKWPDNHSSSEKGFASHLFYGYLFLFLINFLKWWKIFNQKIYCSDTNHFIYKGTKIVLQIGKWKRVLPLTNVIASPFVPNRPARPTRWRCSF